MTSRPLTILNSLVVAALGISVQSAIADDVPGTIPTDLFDSTQGTIIVKHDTLAAPINAFRTTGGFENGHTIMDGPNMGDVSYIEFETPCPVSISGVRLFAAHDDIDSYHQRAMQHFRLLADTDHDVLRTFETTVVASAINPDYRDQPFNRATAWNHLDLTWAWRQPITAQAWRLEVTSAGGRPPYTEPRLVELDALGPGSGDVTLLTLPSVGGSPHPAAAILTHAHTGHGGVFDYASAAQLGAWQTTACHAPKDAVVVPDQNGNRVDDLAVLLDDPDTRRPQVEVRDAQTGQKLRTINFNLYHEGVALALIDDRNGNQSPEAVVLARRSGDQPRLLIRDLVTRDRVVDLTLPKTFRPLGLVMAADFTGNGAPEAMVLAERQSDARGFVLVWDTGGTGKVASVRLPAGYTPLDHAVFSGPSGAAVAVLALRDANQRGRLFVYDALTGVELWANGLRRGRLPVALEAYTELGVARLAVLQERLADSRPLINIYRADNGVAFPLIRFRPNQTPVAFAVVSDLALDGGGWAEFSVLMQDAKLRVRVRDSLTGDLLQTLRLR